MSCAKFRCLYRRIPQAHDDPCATCGVRWSAHSDAARGVGQAAQEAALPPISKWVLQDPGFMVSDAEGDWCEATTAEAWRTEALRQRERADGLEGERAELLKRVAERDGWVCELRERAEKAEAELQEARALAWEQARATVESYGRAAYWDRRWRSCFDLLNAERTAHAATKAALTEAQARIAAGEGQEPVAWRFFWADGRVRFFAACSPVDDDMRAAESRQPLYAAPPSTVTEAECQRRVDEAVREEREACAKVCEEQQRSEPECPERAQYCADAIRARGEVK